MPAKFITASVFGSALVAAVAFAQSPAATTDSARPAAGSASDTSFQGNWSGAKLIGLDVYNESNESLGSISDLLVDRSGNVKGVVIGVGGFLGVGEHLVALPFDRIRFVSEPVAPTGAAGAGNMTGSRPEESTTTTGAASAVPGASQGKPHSWSPDHAVISATKEQLKAIPQFKYEI